MKIRELLSGYKTDTDNIQVAGNMTVIPLVSDQPFTTGVGEVDDVSLKKDMEYGKLCFENQSGRVGIVLQGATIITEQRAQDRTVPRATIIKGKGTENVGAFCVQSSQAGYIDANRLGDEAKEGDSPFMILPPTLRAKALGAGDGYDRLWKHLEHYSGAFSGMASTACLKDIYTKYKDQLDEFVAQFEPVPNQLGAIVLINGDVVAVDIMPTYESWRKMWRTLIRDSYGVEAVRTADQSQGTVFHYDLNMDNITDLDSLENETNRTVSQLVTVIKKQWEGIAEADAAAQVTNNIGGIRLSNIEAPEFTGQAVIHDEHCVYLSLLPKGSTRGTRGRFQRRSKIYDNDDFQF